MCEHPHTHTHTHTHTRTHTDTQTACVRSDSRLRRRERHRIAGKVRQHVFVSVTSVGLEDKLCVSVCVCESGLREGSSDRWSACNQYLTRFSADDNFSACCKHRFLLRRLFSVNVFFDWAGGSRKCCCMGDQQDLSRYSLPPGWLCLVCLLKTALT